MLDNLSLSNLKSGMVVVDYEGEIGIIVCNTTMRCDDFIIYKDTGLCLDLIKNLSDYIKKIYKHTSDYPHDIIQNSTEILNCTKEDFEPEKYDLELIYEKEPKVIEITMAEIEEKFGGKVNIVS